MNTQQLARSKTIPIWTSDIFLIKRTAMQLLAEFIGKQKISLVGVGVENKEKETREDIDYGLCITFVKYHWWI